MAVADAGERVVFIGGPSVDGPFGDVEGCGDLLLCVGDGVDARVAGEGLAYCLELGAYVLCAFHRHGLLGGDGCLLKLERAGCVCVEHGPAEESGLRECETVAVGSAEFYDVGDCDFFDGQPADRFALERNDHAGFVRHWSDVVGGCHARVPYGRVKRWSLITRTA